MPWVEDIMTNYPSALPVPETQIGIAVETTRGTGVAPAFWLPVMAPKYKPDIQYLNDDGLRGSMVELYDMVPGQRYDGHGWDTYPYLDSFPNLLRAELGSADTLTAAPASTTLLGTAAAGATTITTNGSIASGSFLVIDSGVGVQET